MQIILEVMGKLAEWLALLYVGWHWLLDHWFNIFCGYMLWRVVKTTACTHFYVSVRYLSDRTSTFHRLWYPHHYVNLTPQAVDKWTVYAASLFINVKDYSDFRFVVRPYLLGLVRNNWHYFKYYCLVKSITVGVLIMGVGGYYHPYEKAVTGILLLVMVCFSVITMRCQTDKKLRAVMRKGRYPWHVSWHYVVQSLSLGILVPGEKVRGKVVVPLTLLSLLGGILLLLLINGE